MLSATILLRAPNGLTFTTLWLIQQMTNLCYFSHFYQKTESDISCKLSPLEMICMKCQILFLVKIRKKYFKMLSAENFTHSAKC